MAAINGTLRGLAFFACAGACVALRVRDGVLLALYSGAARAGAGGRLPHVQGELTRRRALLAHHDLLHARAQRRLGRLEALGLLGQPRCLVDHARLRAGLGHSCMEEEAEEEDGSEDDSEDASEAAGAGEGGASSSLSSSASSVAGGGGGGGGGDGSSSGGTPPPAAARPSEVIVSMEMTEPEIQPASPPIASPGWVAAMLAAAAAAGFPVGGPLHARC